MPYACVTISPMMILLNAEIFTLSTIHYTHSKRLIQFLSFYFFRLLVCHSHFKLFMFGFFLFVGLIRSFVRQHQF